MLNSPIYFTNTLSSEKELFQPLKAGKVSVYSCGPTVYDSSHIGHARSLIVWDVLIRFLRAAGYEVFWVRNLTDIDDKIINRAARLNIMPEKLARIETYAFWQDMQALNVQWPDLEPRATENLSQMIEFITKLKQEDFAYQAENGDIYFRVGKLKNYGQLKSLSENMHSQARILHAECKEHKNDFALWKSCPKTETGYESPFGYGRPGWHLECSSMIYAHMDSTIDIHTGGDDLIFPHHENEIAQSESHNSGCKLANLWLHNGMLMIEGRKMSKSEQNYVTIKEALSEFSGNAIRFFVLSGHYRQILNYTREGLEGAEKGFQRLKQAASLSIQELPEKSIPPMMSDRLLEHLANDLNTPATLASLFEIVNQINKGDHTLRPLLRFGLQVLGFEVEEGVPQNESHDRSLSDILIEMRQEAREQKNFQLADRIRDLLEKAGYQIQDTSQGSQIQKRRSI